MRKYQSYITAFTIIIGIFAILQLIPTTAHIINGGENRPNSHSKNKLNPTEDADPAFRDEITVTTYVKKTGPFTVNNKIFTIVMTHKKLSRDDTMEYFEIIDENNKVHYKKYFGARIAEGHPDFESTIQMEAYEVSGSNGEGLIIYYTIMPNAPPAGESFQLFGLEKGMLKPLTSAVGIAGGIHELPKGDSRRSLKLLDGDVIYVEIWTNYFAVIIPIAVDFKQLLVKPAKSSGTFDIYYPRSILKSGAELEGKKIALYSNHDSNLIAEDIILTGVKKIDYLYAYADIQLKKHEHRDEVDISNLWLKISIDGKEGWINDGDSFQELGFYSP